MLLDINYILCVMNRPASKGSQLSGRTLPESDQNGYWRWSTGCRSGTSRHKNGKFVPPPPGVYHFSCRKMMSLLSLSVLVVKLFEFMAIVQLDGGEAEDVTILKWAVFVINGVFEAFKIKTFIAM